MESQKSSESTSSSSEEIPESANAKTEKTHQKLTLPTLEKRGIQKAKLWWRRLTLYIVTASSGTAISTDFATLTCSEILSKILIRCVTWHCACDCSFRCFHEIGRYFDNKEQERAKTQARRHERSQRRQEHPKIDSF